MISAELMYEKVMHRMDMTKETKEEELQEIIRTVLEDESKKEFIPLVLVHITDIHLENDTDYNILEGRSEYIANAINKHIIDETNTLLILCITGDIAYSGKEEQYLFASIFICCFKRLSRSASKKRENRSTQNRTAGRVPGRAGSETSTD